MPTVDFSNMFVTIGGRDVTEHVTCGPSIDITVESFPIMRELVLRYAFGVEKRYEVGMEPCDGGFRIVSVKEV